MSTMRNMLRLNSLFNNKPKKNKYNTFMNIGIVTIITVLVVLYLYPELFTNRKTLENYQSGTMTQDDLNPPEGEIYVVMFYANWCGYCKRLKPIFTDVMNQVNSTDNSPHNITMKMVDCVANEDLCQAHAIEGYPTLKIISNDGGDIQVRPLEGYPRDDVDQLRRHILTIKL